MCAGLIDQIDPGCGFPGPETDFRAAVNVIITTLRGVWRAAALQVKPPGATGSLTPILQPSQQAISS